MSSPLSRPIRVLVAKVGLDGHDRGAKVIASFLRDAGMEVIYTGLRQTPEMVVNAALQERGVALDAPSFSVVSNPEFLKEGAAVDDFMRPDRIVLGTYPDAAGEQALALMRELYAPFTRNHDRILSMEVRSSEFTK